MTLKKIFTAAILGTGLLSLAACNSMSAGSPSIFGTKDPQVAGAQTHGVGQLARFDDQGGAHFSPDGTANNQTYYFAFDNDKLSQKDLASLRHQADFLHKHPQVRVLIAGNTDERGSREYNIALGERRAESVEQILMREGVNKDQVTVVSYGEEKPAVLGHNESAYRLNRRVNLNFQSQS